MSTVRTCTTPKEGWALIHHFLGNSVPVIALATERFLNESDVDELGRLGDDINRSWACLVGNIYLIIKRMRTNRNYGEAARMQWFLNMIIDQDFTDPGTVQAVVAKEEELNPELRDLNQMVKKLFPK